MGGPSLPNAAQLFNKPNILWTSRWWLLPSLCSRWTVMLCSSLPLSSPHQSWSPIIVSSPIRPRPPTRLTCRLPHTVYHYNNLSSSFRCSLRVWFRVLPLRPYSTPLAFHSKALWDMYSHNNSSSSIITHSRATCQTTETCSHGSPATWEKPTGCQESALSI